MGGSWQRRRRTNCLNAGIRTDAAPSCLNHARKLKFGMGKLNLRAAREKKQRRETTRAPRTTSEPFMTCVLGLCLNSANYSLLDNVLKHERQKLKQRR